MSLTEKYKDVLDLGQRMDVAEGYVKEEGGKLKIGGTAKTQYLKDLLWDKIKEIGGDNPSDVEADIKVAVTDCYHVHAVQSGNTLSGIAKKYLGDASRYTEIFELNKNQLSDPNNIQVGQELKIPFK